MPHTTQKEVNNNFNEISFLKSLDHPNIVKYYRCYLGKQGEELWVIMEFLEGGTLTQARSSFKFSEEHIAYICREILTGLSYLHSLRIAHRDVKSANVMLAVTGAIKLIDFGLCAPMGDSTRDEMCGSPFWLPPEMIHKQPYQFQVDIWSSAICFLELANGHPPHEHSSLKAMFIAATEGYPQPFDNPSKWSDEMKEFYQLCLRVNPAERATAPQLLENNWLKKAATKKAMKNVLTDIFIRETLQSVGFGGF
eukprot:TRINITY_DN2379_c0_g3_i1.p1 TRINITY_DN2379_c0_g3~~TRINITY_DN2379_c0_g3_i1.p1  ORF type:complete len:252 (-),score=122.66 TRINITY_DN2379_c0_g3_i1:66-821(-)